MDDDNDDNDNDDGNDDNDDDDVDEDDDDKDDDKDDDIRGREAAPGARAEYRQLPARVSSLRSSKVFSISSTCISVFLQFVLLYFLVFYMYFVDSTFIFPNLMKIPASVSILRSSRI